MTRPHLRASGKRKPRQSSHAAEFETATVHFVMTVTVARRFDVARAARLLLLAGVAVSAAWSDESVIRVDPRLRRNARQLKRARLLHTRVERLRKDVTWRSAFALLLSSPRSGLGALGAVWRSQIVAPRLQRLADSNSLWQLAWFVVRHPVIGARDVLPLVRFSRGASATDAKGRNATTESPKVDTVLRESQGTEHSRGDKSDLPEDADDMGTSELLEILDDAEHNYIQLQVVSAAERIVDAQLFGHTRAARPYVRLMLRGSYHHFQVEGASATHHVVLEPRVMLHPDGVIQLDVALRASGSLSTAQLLEFMQGGAPRIVSSEMSTPLYEGTEWEPLAKLIEGEVDRGKPLAKIHHSAPASVAQLLHVHLGAVFRAANLSGDIDWLLYPILFTQPGACCTAGRWRSNHAHDLHLIAIRGHAQATISPHVEAPTDLSLRSSHSLFASLGSAVYVRWSGALPSGIRELDTTLVFEYALQLYMRLVAMEVRVAELSLGDRTLRHRYREALRLFSELRQGSLRSGEARDVAKAVLRELGADDIRPTIETALSLAGTAHDTVSSARAARQSWWLTVLATIVAFLVAVPTLQQLLAALPASAPSPLLDLLLSPLRWASNLGFWGPWMMMAAILAAVSFGVAFGWIVRHRPRTLPSLRRGFAWPTSFTITSYDGPPQPAEESHQQSRAAPTTSAPSDHSS